MQSACAMSACQQAIADAADGEQNAMPGSIPTGDGSVELQSIAVAWSRTVHPAATVPSAATGRATTRIVPAALLDVVGVEVGGCDDDAEVVDGAAEDTGAEVVGGI